MGLKQAISAWTEAIGTEAVLADQKVLMATLTATFATAQRVPALIRPANRSQVQDCLRIAARFGVTVYPVSRGKNWGLGSRVPVRDGCVVMMLDRLNRIVEFDEDLAYMTVEPGVTFQQAADYLQGRKSSLFLAMTGGPPDSSLIGNALERGDAVGPYGERISHACAMEFVLPDGSCVHTGFQRFSGSRVSKIARSAPGPSLNGLLTQSNLGIVTEMTFWLMRRPPYFQSFLFTVKDRQRLLKLIDNLRCLQSLGILKNNSIAMWNAHKMVACERQYPWELTSGRTPLSTEQIRQLDSPWSGIEWVGVGALYSASRRHAKADRSQVRKALRNHVERLVFLNRFKSKMASVFKYPLNRLTGLNVGEALRALYDESIFLGFPTHHSAKSTYWRKKMPWPAEMDPDRHQCGVIWLCPVIPYDAMHLHTAIDSIIKISERHRFEPQVAFMFPSERAVHMFPSIIYDRAVPGEDERAMACHDEMFSAMLTKGYYPYRLGIQSMAHLPTADDDHDRLVGKIKALIDPAHCISPGRYDFCMVSEQEHEAGSPTPPTDIQLLSKPESPNLKIR